MLAAESTIAGTSALLALFSERVAIKVRWAFEDAFALMFEIQALVTVSWRALSIAGTSAPKTGFVAFFAGAVTQETARLRCCVKRFCIIVVLAKAAPVFGAV